MNDDSLNHTLREWQAPEPSPALDAHMLAAFRAGYRRSPWRTFWSARISVPAPALALGLILVLAIFLQFRSTPAPVAPRVDRGYVTRLEATGFQPLPDGAARVVAVEGVRQ